MTPRNCHASISRNPPEHVEGNTNKSVRIRRLYSNRTLRARQLELNSFLLEKNLQSPKLPSSQVSLSSCPPRGVPSKAALTSGWKPNPRRPVTRMTCSEVASRHCLLDSILRFGWFGELCGCYLFWRKQGPQASSVGPSKSLDECMRDMLGIFRVFFSTPLLTICSFLASETTKLFIQQLASFYHPQSQQVAKGKGPPNANLGPQTRRSNGRGLQRPPPFRLSRGRSPSARRSRRRPGEAGETQHSKSRLVPLVGQGT